jgi:hypothetical protein
VTAGEGEELVGKVAVRRGQSSVSESTSGTTRQGRGATGW